MRGNSFSSNLQGFAADLLGAGDGRREEEFVEMERGAEL